MESLDKNNYIIIGKYWISKTILMSYPCWMTVINSLTGESKSYCGEDKVFQLLIDEGLDTEPLYEYFDKINGTTKEDRNNALKIIDEWEQKQKDKL